MTGSRRGGEVLRLNALRIQQRGDVPPHQLEALVDPAAERAGENDDGVGGARPRMILLREDEEHEARDDERRDQQ